MKVIYTGDQNNRILMMPNPINIISRECNNCIFQIVNASGVENLDPETVGGASRPKQLMDFVLQQVE